MKKALYVLLALSLVFAFSCKEEAGDMSVASVSPGDLADYTPNGVSPSADGGTELMAAALAGYAMSGVVEDWAASEEDIAALMAGSSMMGLTRAITVPEDTEIEELMTAMSAGGDFSMSASIVDETVSFSDFGSAGTMTLNASVSVDGDISDPNGTSGTDTISGDAEFEIVGSSIVTDGVDMPGMALNLASDTKVVHTYDDTSDSVSVNTNSALVLAFSLSDIDTGSGSVAPSGKYIYTLTLNEQVAVDTTAAEPEFDVTATMTLKIYDNDDLEIASYSYDSDDFEALAADM